MATFPRTEPQIVALVQKVIAGCIAPVFPAPPVLPTALTAALTNYLAAREDYVNAQAVALHALESKDRLLETLCEAVKKDLRYAENTVDPVSLALIGWGPKAAPTKLAAPGQCRSLEITQQDEGWLTLDWKEPADGGDPAAYKVQRRERPAGPWNDVATALESEITLTEQTRSKEFEYRVRAANKAGDGEPSNSVMAVL